jgi:hypothetical protein
MAPQNGSHPDLVAESPLTNNFSTQIDQPDLDGDEYPDTPSLSSSSDDFEPTSIPKSISPASSVGSDLRSDKDDAKRLEMRLPEPFYPPSMAHNVSLKPRTLPVDLGLPPVPEEKAGSAIDPKDMWVIFARFHLVLS